MSNITYPDGTILTSTALTRKQIETAFQIATGNMLGIASDDSTLPIKIRIGWQEEGQPGPQISTDTTFVRCGLDDTAYSRMRDLTPSTNGDTITYTDVYTRSWKTYWTFYGDDALDNRRAIVSGLIKIQFVADYLSTFNLYINPDIPETPSFPENFQGRWWERADLEVQVNEQITETNTVGTAGSVEIKTYTKDGLLSDFTVTLP